MRLNSGEKIFDRYVSILKLFVDFADFAESDKKINGTNFVKNLLIKSLRGNKSFESVILKNTYYNFEVVLTPILIQHVKDNLVNEKDDINFEIIYRNDGCLLASSNNIILSSYWLNILKKKHVDESFFKNE